MPNANIRDDSQIDVNIDLATTMEQQHKLDEKLSSSSQEEDDSECWDDAKALLHNENNPRNNSNDCEVDKPDSSSVNIDTFQPSSSSAYSSIQSNNVGSLAPQSKLNSNSEPTDDLVLHEAVFNNDINKIFTTLNDTELVKRKDIVNKRDKHGNTALHLACILGRPKEVVSAFLQSNQRWSIDVRNLNRWTPFHEACSYGDREIIKLLTKQLQDDVDDAINNSKLSDFLEKTKNYRLVLKWEFQSWVPFVSRVLPSDVCVINKQGKFIRIDTRLVDFEGLFRKKGDSCLVYSNKKWIIMNNKTKKYQYFESPNIYKDIDERVDEFMSTDIMDIELKSSEMQLSRSTSGWIWKADKVGKVGRYNAALYDFTNVFLVVRKRREHLSEDDLKRNKNAYRSAVHIFEFGEKPNTKDLDKASSQDGDAENADESDSMEGQEETVDHRESLPPPPSTNVTWQQYIQAEPGNYPTIGREQRCKILRKPVKASVALSEEFPITKNEFLDLLSIVPLKLFRKLKEFVEMKLPDGFPVRLDIPVFPFLTARITFEDFTFIEGPIDESLFAIPEDYEKDSNLLPGKLKGDNNSGPTSHKD